jgi:hypothetical protein
MLAMMYLVLFAVLAVGFYASTGTSAQVSHNERRRAEALSAAESGMDYLRYHLAQVIIPPTVAEASIISEVHKDLKAQIEGTPNMGIKTVGLNMGGTQIDVPNGTNEYITLNGTGAKFRAQIHRNGRQLVVKVIGCYSNTPISNADRAAVELRFGTKEHETDFFENGMAARGAISLTTALPIVGVPAEQASILSTSTAIPPVTVGTLLKPSGISGDITVLTGQTPVVNVGTSVGGTTNTLDIMTNHVHHIDAAAVPEFPTPDTTLYRPFATNTYVSGLTYYENIVIPPNTNPSFSGPMTVRGVVYIKQPNNVTFAGNVTIQGVIVTEPAGVGTLLNNIITFTGSGGSKEGVETLPNDPQFLGLKALGGSFVVAPQFDVRFTGNFNSIGGHVVGDKVSIGGSSDITVLGSVVALKQTLSLSTNGSLVFKESPMGGHGGLRFSEKYVPLPASYDEVKP